MARNARAFEVANGAHPDARNPGAYYFLTENGARVGIIHACPCGCGGKSAMFFRGTGHGNHEWDVIGEWPKVTCSPSIGIKYDGEGGRAQYHWHGFLENGEFVER